MSTCVPHDFYLQWRAQEGAPAAFRDSAPGGPPPERWLQEVWAHQRVRREELKTTDGRRLTVLHPGLWNHEAGPDFRGAMIQIDDQEPVTGDIEIDLTSAGWKSHGHFQNPEYAQVVLHVVWEPSATPPLLPTLGLQALLDEPVQELGPWIGGPAEFPAEWLSGHCASPLRHLDTAQQEALLLQAAAVRLRCKAHAFRARARVAGWHQALWEGAFRALGYKHNAWPMQRLAELLPVARGIAVESREGWEARLLGLSGLLPAEPQAGSYGRRLWDLWWRDRDTLRPHILPPLAWRLNGVRPANHPQRRIALAAAWVADPDWPGRVETWFAQQTDDPDPNADESLTESIRPEAVGFWRRHYTLTARDLPEAPPLLGAGRLADLAANVILPWLWARADAGTDPAARQRVEQLYFRWPPGEDNTALKLVRARLLGEAPLPGRRSVALQQGLLQVARDFCSTTNLLCENCRFPALVAQWNPSVPGTWPEPTPAPTP
ncbi:MAG: DUF2851 family protein [Verrucomicrobiales bacterium]|nr:DUF2851 family protein [Verrucomicrobiales bacterium]